MEVTAIVISIIALVISIITIFYDNKKAQERDLYNKRREVRVGYYIKAFMLFASIAQKIRENRCSGASVVPRFDEAYHYIQLLGDEEIIRTWDKFREALSDNRSSIHPSILDNIIICTQAKIRADLGMLKKDVKITYYE